MKWHFWRRPASVPPESFGDPAPEKVTNETAMWRGEQAKRLMADPLLKEAFATVDASLLEAWTRTGDKQERERERLWMMIHLLRRVHAHLEQAAAGGKVAEHNIAAARKNERGAYPIR